MNFTLGQTRFGQRPSSEKLQHILALCVAAFAIAVAVVVWQTTGGSEKSAPAPEVTPALETAGVATPSLYYYAVDSPEDAAVILAAASDYTSPYHEVQIFDLSTADGRFRWEQLNRDLWDTIALGGDVSNVEVIDLTTP